MICWQRSFQRNSSENLLWVVFYDIIAVLTKRNDSQRVFSQRPTPQYRLADRVVTLTVSGGSSFDFNKREECAGEISLHGLLSRLPDLSRVQLMNTFIVLLSKWPPSSLSDHWGENNFDVIWNFTQQCRTIWFAAGDVWQSSLIHSHALDNFCEGKTMVAFVSCAERIWAGVGGFELCAEVGCD